LNYHLKREVFNELPRNTEKKRIKQVPNKFQGKNFKEKTLNINYIVKA
jgi:hypothetical protein